MCATDWCTNTKVFSRRLCRRCHAQITIKGHVGCDRCQGPTRPYRRECDACVTREFLDRGFVVTIEDYRGTQKPVEVRCVRCGTISTKWLSNLRKGHGCEGCYAPIRAQIGDRTRFTQAEAAKLLACIGLRMTSAYINANAPVACLCTGCGRQRSVRVGHISKRIQDGDRVFGCSTCYHRKRSEELRTPLETAMTELLEANIEYLSGWVNANIPFSGRCLLCGRPVHTKLSHIRAGHTGCRSCSGAGFISRPRLERHPELANAPAYIYVIEFEDFNGTIFHKIGISRSDASTNRIDQHTTRYNGRLITRTDADLLTCYLAEQMVKQHVGPRSYRPHPDRIAGGHSECYLPEDPIDLDHWLEKARAATNQPRPQPQIGGPSTFRVHATTD